MSREGITFNDIGWLYANQGRYEEALDHYQEALDIHREVGNRTGEGTSLNNIGLVYYEQGRYEEALDHYQQALEVARTVDNRTGEGITLNNIGLVYAAQGRYEEALNHYQQALAIAREVNNRSGEGRTLDSIGLIYNVQGRYEETLNYYQQALSIQRDVGDRQGESTTLNNIGLIYYEQGRYDDALEHFQQALSIQRDIGDRQGESTTLNNIGLIYYKQGRYENALDHYYQALEIASSISNRSEEGNVLHNIGLLYDAQGRYDEALEQYQEALKIYCILGNPVGESTTLFNIGMAYIAQGRYDEALDHVQQALDVLEDVRTTVGSDTARARFISSIEEKSAIFEGTILLAYQEDERFMAFRTTEHGRARTFLDGLATGQVQLADNEANELIERESSLYTERQATQDAIAQARAADPPDDDLITDLEADLEQLEEDYVAVQEEIAGRSDQLAALVPGRSAVPELDEIQVALDADTTLLSYWVTDEQTFAFVVTQNALEVVALEVTRDDLFDRVETLRRFSNLGEPYPTAAVDLHELLIAPVAEHLTTGHLAIIPHDVLHYLPFAALSDGERFLVDDYTLTLLPSASGLLHIQQNTGHDLTAPLILGDPATDNADLPALGGAEQEAETIASLYGSTPLLGDAATEAEVRGEATEAGILHIAAHGAFNQAAPLESTLYLTPDGDDDGRLTVREVYGLDLQQADLVVLSVCEKQIDDRGIVHGQLSVDSGDELVGLTRAFFYAGTPSVVSTLWRVDDESSMLLMERFYTNLHNGIGKAEALRQAQMDVREQHPNLYYWAGYVLSGEAGELETDNTGNNIILLLAVVAGLLIAIAGGLYLMRRNWIVSTGRSG